MLEDGLQDRHGVPVPNVVVGQYVVNIRAGIVTTHSLAGKNVFEVTGRSQDCIDHVALACYTIVRLRSISSR